jgi:glycosyltransferase involved in cell wall biosynthesis
MKKIAILADFPLHLIPQSGLPKPAGHYATWLPQLARAFEHERHFEIHWVALDSSLISERRFPAWNQYFHVLPTTARGRAATLFWSDRREISRKLQNIGPDLVHGWGSENIWGWASAFSGYPNIFSLQGLLSEYQKLATTGYRDRLMALMEILVLRKAQVVTTESLWARSLIEKKTGRKDTRLVEYGVSSSFFDVTISSSSPSLPGYAVMVGTADFRKGIDFAVQLFRRPALHEVTLKVAGAISPFGEYWKERSPSNVEWLGQRSQGEIIDLLAKSRCLILPTRADVCANVVKEARVMGLPVVASPHGGHAQYIVDGKNGFLCPLEDWEAWEKALLKTFKIGGVGSTMGNFLQKEHRALLRPERTAQAFLALYIETLESLPHPKARR